MRIVTKVDNETHSTSGKMKCSAWCFRTGGVSIALSSAPGMVIELCVARASSQRWSSLLVHSAASWGSSRRALKQWRHWLNTLTKGEGDSPPPLTTQVGHEKVRSMIITNISWTFASESDLHQWICTAVFLKKVRDTPKPWPEQK